MSWKLITQCQKKYPKIKDVYSFEKYPDAIQNKSCYNFWLLNWLLFWLSFKKETLSFEKSIIPIFENKAEWIVLKSIFEQHIIEEGKELTPDNVYEFDEINNNEISKDSICTLYEAWSSDPFRSLNITNWKNIAKQNSFINSINDTKNYLILQGGTWTDDYLSYSSLFIHSNVIDGEKISEQYHEAYIEAQNKWDWDWEKVKKYENIIRKNTEVAENINRDKIIQKYNLKIISQPRMRHRMPIFYEFVKFKWINGWYWVLECKNPMG
jgi:hypothetical protein